MNVHGNPLFRKGNKLAHKAKGKPKKPEIARLLEQYAPRVLEVIEARLAATDPEEQWITAKELLPYLWSKKAAVAVSQEDEQRPVTLADYLAAKQQEQAETPSPNRTAHTQEPVSSLADSIAAKANEQEASVNPLRRK